jgi:hypothetical protein
VKRQVVDSIGLLDERYFAYHEDLGYCLRATVAGFQTLVVPEAVLRHKSARSLGGEDSPVKEYLFVRNSYLLWSTHLTGWRRYTYPRRYLTWVLTRVVAARQAGKHAIADHGLDAAWDAFHGRWGSWEVRSQMPSALRLFLLNYLLAWHPYFWIMLEGTDLPSFQEARSPDNDPITTALSSTSVVRLPAPNPSPARSPGHAIRHRLRAGRVQVHRRGRILGAQERRHRGRAAACLAPGA